ncbi:MAG: hypothetical protein J6X03_04625, partial [Bacilli bacterium]|nr:hypothetical protein [Bacilli bacterium]
TSFEEEVYEEDGKRVKIIYETYDTNETMYNTLKTGKQTYDILCCSDYMIQRLAREEMISSFADFLEDGSLSNYTDYVSPFLADYSGNGAGKLNQIKVQIPNGTDSDGNIIYDETHDLTEYTVGYMWGTLGILYNPELIVQKNGNLFRANEDYEDYSDEELQELIVDQFSSIDGYSYLWEKEFKGTQSIKDSMRDTYAIGIFEVFKDQFSSESASYLADYDDRNELFNSCDDATIKKVEQALINLKENIFGFEVDSGKDDIVTKKIGVNIAWSGDATNAIGRGYYADDDMTIPRDEEDEVVLYYTIPSLGANIWFDSWAQPMHDEAYYESDECKYAIEFLNYLNDPWNAMDNMSYNGYTTFVGTNADDQEILNYILYCYDLTDPEDDEANAELDEYDLSYYFDFVDEEGNPLEYIDVTVVDPFAETDEEALEGDGREFRFEDEDGDGKIDVIIKTDLTSFEGRSLVAQYPSESDIDNLYVMRDFGTQNDKIVSMWENVKVNPLPVWVVVVLITFIVGVLAYLASYKAIKRYKVAKRKALRKQQL